MSTATAAVPLPETTPDLVSERQLGLINLVLVLGAITTFLDTTIVNIALDHLTAVFHASVSNIQWVSTGYLLAFVAVIPVSGWAAERFGMRRMWMLAEATFLLGSVLCGASWSLPVLITFRVLQGLGGGMVLPLTIAIATRAAGPKRLTQAMVTIGFVGQLAPVLGPVIGGSILSSFDWRWLFYVNVPICVAALILAPLFLPVEAGQARHRFDLLGFILLTPAVALIALGVSQGSGTNGFTALQSWLPLALGLALMLGFIAHALTTARTPLIDVRVFARRSFSLSGIITFVSGFSVYALMFLLPLFYQQIRGESVMHTGLLLIPQGLGTMLFLVAYRAKLSKVDGRFVVAGGVLLTMMGIVPFALTGASGNDVLLLVGQFVQGIGLGGATVPVMTLALASLSPAETARGSAAFNVVQRVGAPFGVAIVAVILQAALRGTTTSAAPSTAASAAFNTTFWWVLGLSAIPLVLAFFIPSRPAPVTSTTAP